MRKPLTPEQAVILRRDYQAKQAADVRWAEDMALLGVEVSQIVSGNLDGAEPHLLLKDGPDDG